MRSAGRNTILSIPVGDGFLGRVIDPLGRPMDGLGEIETRGAPEPGGPGALGRAAPAGEGARCTRASRRSTP